MADFDRHGNYEREQYTESDVRSQSSQPSDHGYHSAGASSDIGTSGGSSYHISSSVRSVGSIGSQGSGGGEPHHSTFNRDRGFPSAGFYNHHFNNRGGPYGFGPTAAHLVTGETQFPPSLYHPAADAPKSDTATVCSGSVLEDIEVESVLSQEAGPQQPWSSGSKHHSPPSSVKMAVVSLRRSNSAGNRLVDYADRSQELLTAVIPQQRAGMAIAEEYPAVMQMQSSNNGMGPPLSRTLLSIHGGYSSRPGSVKSFESKADSDLVAHVDTDDCGGSLNESITDNQSVLSQEDPGDPSARAQAKSPSVPSPGDNCESNNKPHPFLCGDSDPQNGRTSPGGTIYRGRGVRRYQGRYMHLPLKRFHQNGVHLRSVNEQQMGDEDAFGSSPPYYGDNDNWQDRYEGDAWERRSQSSSANLRPHHFGSNRKRSASRSRSRSRSPDGHMDEGTESGGGRNNGGKDGNYDNSNSNSTRNYRGRRRNGYSQSNNNSQNKNGYKNGNHRPADDGYGDRNGNRNRHRSNRP
eukprot:scaffold22713_cov139-Cylindrotheca_fusiformis.AAC.15